MVQYITLEGQIKVIIDTQNGQHTPHYVYTDHLGSIVKVTNAGGYDEVSQNFDPWGRRRDMGTWTYVDDNAPLGHPIWLYRGYTGHEHLPQFRLINMNGRLYDPELARMLSPDNVIPDGGDTQSYNKYSYVNNNPLRYIDPDGNEPITFALVAITVFSAVHINGTINHFQGKPFYDGAVQTALVAAATSVVSFGIGGLAKLIPNIYLRAGFQAVAHGQYNGISTELQGDKFIHGFASGSISSISGSLTGGLKMGVVGKVAIGGVTGGVVSAVVGGDFYRGFLQGAIITAFNHLLHNAIDGVGSEIKIGDPEVEKAKEYLAGEFLAGRITKSEYLQAYYILDGQTSEAILEILKGHAETIVTLGAAGLGKLALSLSGVKGVQTTLHGSERIAGAAATRGGVLSIEGINSTKSLGKVFNQTDGAKVFLHEISPGKFNAVIQNQTGKVITTMSNWSLKSINRIAKNYGWKIQ